MPKKPKATNPLLRTPMHEREFPGVDAPIFEPGELGMLPSPKACKECPLRRESAPGYLGGYTVEQYLVILHSDADIACHLSPGFPDDRARQRSCTGVAVYRNNVCKLPRGPSHAREACNAVSRDKERFFATPMEFAAHHVGAGPTATAASTAKARGALALVARRAR